MFFKRVSKFEILTSAQVVSLKSALLLLAISQKSAAYFKIVLTMQSHVLGIAILAQASCSVRFRYKAFGICWRISWHFRFHPRSS